MLSLAAPVFVGCVVWWFVCLFWWGGWVGVGGWVVGVGGGGGGGWCGMGVGVGRRVVWGVSVVVVEVVVVVLMVVWGGSFGKIVVCC